MTSSSPHLSSEVDLKPCPFCGAEARTYQVGQSMWHACCTGGSCSTDPMTESCATEADAITLWNTRHEASGISSLLERNERLEEALTPFAKAADVRLCGEWADDEHFGQTDVGFYLTFGDLRAARAALETQDRGSASHD